MSFEVTPGEPSDQLGEELGKDSAGIEEEEDGHKDHHQAVDQEGPEGGGGVEVDEADVVACHGCRTTTALPAARFMGCNEEVVAAV
ncbi:hypothetical protein EC968_009282 [Mortierella alpina]|nr:hypothetical protein EC968_009282 [Mortierella alpina]